MAAEVGENAIDIALKVARALTSVGADYFLGGSLRARSKELSRESEPNAIVHGLLPDWLRDDRLREKGDTVVDSGNLANLAEDADEPRRVWRSAPEQIEISRFSIPY